MCKGRLVFAVLFLVLAVAAGFASPHDTLPGSVQPVAAQASLAPSTTTVTNNVTLSPGSISLGSVLEANGQVSAAGKPLANASVALHMGDVIVASAQTDQLGRYTFSAPVGAYYFPAAFSNGATAYTVVEPSNSSFISTPSTATSVPVDLAPLYAIIALITAAVVVVLYLWVRRFRGKGSPAAAAVTTPSTQAQTPVVASETTAEEPPQEARGAAPQIEGAMPIAGESTEEQAQAVSESEPAVLEDAGDATALKQARELFEQGNDLQAIAALYDAALALLASRAGVTLAPHMTHWEHYAVIEAAVPEMREPLRTLTLAFERTHYGGKSLTDEERATSIAAFQSIYTFDEHGGST